MSNIPELTDIIEYELYNENYNREVVPEPIGWKSDLPQLARSDKNYTTTTKYSTNLEFVGAGADFIEQVFSLFGFEAKIILTKRRQHPIKQEVEIRYRAILDGYTFKREKGNVKINAVESDLTAKVNGYKNESVELNRELSIDGIELEPLNVKTVNMTGKQIKLVSKWDVYDEYTPYTVPHGGGNQIEYVTFQMKQIANSDDQTASVTNPRLNNGQNNLPLSGSTQNMFYAIANDDRVFDLDIDLDFEMRRTTGTNMGNNFFVLYLIKFYDDSVNGNSQYRYLSREQLAVDQGVTSVDEDGKQVKTLQYSGRLPGSLAKGESYALAIYSSALFADRVDITYNKTSVEIIEDSLVEGSQSEAIYVYDAIERLLRIMTGETTQVLYSDFFGRTELGYAVDGPGAYLCITSGFLVRQFTDKPLSTDFDDMMKSLLAVLNVSYSFEKEGFKEFLRVEPMEYFFGPGRHVLDKVVSSQDIKLSVNEKFSNSGILLGFAEGGADYDEAVGLDEPNGQINWLTPLAKAKNLYEQLSPYRGDSTALEFARRKNQLNFPTEDTDYDDSIFLLDCKPGVGEVLELRKWQDDFATAPRNIYSPETAYNLRFSPRAIFQRHSFMFNAGLTTYNDRFVRFGSGVGNSDLILDGIESNADILIQDLDYARFKNIWIEFSLDTDYYTEQAVLDNIYGIFEFNNEKGQTFQFRLFDFKNNKYKGLLINGFQ